MVIFYQTWPIYGCTNLLWKFYPFTDGVENFLEKTQEDVAGGSSFVFKREGVVEGFFKFEIQQTYANPLFVLTLAIYTPTRCDNPCRPVFIRVRILIQKRVDLRLDKSIPAVSETWLSPIFNEQEQRLKMKVSLQQAGRNLFALLLMGFDLIATL